MTVMSVVDPPVRVDLRTVMFESPADAASTVANAVRYGNEIGGAVERMPAAAKEAVLARIGEAATSLLEQQDLIDIFGKAWRKHLVFRPAAVETMAVPGAEMTVDLAVHKVSFGYEPIIDVRVGDWMIGTITIQVSVEALIEGVRAVVRGGRLTAIRSGSCNVESTLAVGGQEVLQLAASFNLPAVIHLNPGIPLLADLASHR